MTKISSYILASLIVFSSVGGCKDRDISVLEIVNITPRALTGVSVNDSRREWKLGTIQARGVTKFSGALYGEGGATVSWTEDGKRYSAGLCYYSMRFPASGRIFLGNGTVKYDCSNKVNRRL
jgi:hypothetical protein